MSQSIFIIPFLYFSIMMFGFYFIFYCYRYRIIYLFIIYSWSNYIFMIIDEFHIFYNCWFYYYLNFLNHLWICVFLSLMNYWYEYIMLLYCELTLISYYSLVISYFSWCYILYAIYIGIIYIFTYFAEMLLVFYLYYLLQLDYDIIFSASTKLYIILYLFKY